MTNSEIDIAIAKALGAKTCAVHLTVGCCGNPVLNYCTDLNAMAQAEETLGTLKYKFGLALMDACSKPDIASCIHATASQRAEAFLRVKGLWKE